MTNPDPWEPPAQLLIAAGLALLASLGLAIAISVRSVQFFTLNSILPTLFTVQPFRHGCR
jgi:hypothetical protein